MFSSSLLVVTSWCSSKNHICCLLLFFFVCLFRYRLIVIVVITVVKLSSLNIIFQLYDGFSISVALFHWSGQRSASCQIQVLQSVTSFEESRQWFQIDASTAEVEFPKKKKQKSFTVSIVFCVERFVDIVGICTKC